MLQTFKVGRFAGINFCIESESQKCLYFVRVWRTVFAGVGGDAGFNAFTKFRIVNFFPRCADETKVFIDPAINKRAKQSRNNLALSKIARAAKQYECCHANSVKSGWFALKWMQKFSQLRAEKSR